MKGTLVNEFSFNDIPVRVVDSRHIPFPGVFHLEGKLIINKKIYEKLPMEDLNVLLTYGHLEKEYHERGLCNKDPYNECAEKVGHSRLEDVLVGVMKLH